MIKKKVEDILKERRRDKINIPSPFKRFNPDDYQGLQEGESSIMFTKKN